MLYSGAGERNFMKLPNPMEKRSVLHGVKDYSPEKLSAFGEELFKKGQFSFLILAWNHFRYAKIKNIEVLQIFIESSINLYR